MIARIWRGATATSDREDYLEYLDETGVKEYAATPGNRGVLVLTRDTDGVTEYTLVSLWESWEAIEAFAGSEPGRAVFYPEDDRFLVRRDLEVEHHELAASAGLDEVLGDPAE